MVGQRTDPIAFGIVGGHSDKTQNSFKQGTFLSKLRDSRFCRNLMMAACRWAAHTAFWSSCARCRKINPKRPARTNTRKRLRRLLH